MFIDPRQIFCYVGTAVRIGQRMGLHRDGAIFGLSPFEIEQRRRLWWTIVGYDRRIGEMTGSTVTALSTIGDCKLPLNINDADLHVDGKEAPAAQTGSTEMLFSLIRAELAMAISTDASKDRKADVDKSNPSIHKPMSMVRMAGPGGKAYTLDGFFAHIEGTYLRTCDQKIPLHFFTLAMTRQALCKMRVVAFLLRLGVKDPDAALSAHEKEMLTEDAIQMIEYDNIIQSNPTLKGFAWYTFLHFPFPAYMYLVNELRRNTQGPIADRAWEAIAQNHELRGLMNTMHNPMHLAFGHLFVKAWDAREAALRAAGIMQHAPSWIPTLRQRMMKKRKRTREDTAEPRPARVQPPVPSRDVPGLAPQQPLQQARPPPSQTSTSPESSGVMVTPPGADPGMEAAASQLMGYSDLTNDFGDLNWGFFMQGYDMNTIAGLGAGFGAYTVEDQHLPVVSPHDGIPPGMAMPLQQPPPPEALNNMYRGG
jgi:transcription factor-like protein